MVQKDVDVYIRTFSCPPYGNSGENKTICNLHCNYMQIITKLYIKLEVSVYHVNIQEGSPSHFSNKSYTLIKILPDQEKKKKLPRFVYEM